MLVVLIILAVVAGVIAGFLPQLQRQRVARAEEDHLQTQIKQRRERVARQTRELNWLKNDPSYVEIIARDRLDLMKEGETIYRLDPPKTPPANSNGGSLGRSTSASPAVPRRTSHTLD